MKVEYVCDACGSSEISRDAWADWDTATQQWVLGAVFDYAHCHRCERETSLEEQEVPEPKGQPSSPGLR
ncbi:MAG TPA: hypothetical protein VM657_00825 [Sphingomonas sp.]|nr:hypothetical protein [Sphingomonas sp.]